MGKKQRKVVPQQVFDRRKDESIDEFSPFKDVVLKEKKAEKSAGKKLPGKESDGRKKPSEIVQGYDPGASFADILSSYERTGNPYSMPRGKADRGTEKKVSKDFGEILAMWEGGVKKKKSPTSQGKVSKPYEPTKSFAEIFEEYEGLQGERRTEAREEEKPREATAKSPNGKVSKYVHGSGVKLGRSFAEMLDEFDGVTHPRTEDRTAEEVGSAEGNAKEVCEADDVPQDGPKRFFRVCADDEERSPKASWSIFGGNDSFVRSETEDEPEKNDLAAKEDENTRESAPYRPTKDFSEILSSYYGGESRKLTSKRGKQKPKAEDIDAGKEAVKHPEEGTSLPRTFEEMLEEKGDDAPRCREYTISQLRTMMPQATLDLHGLTGDEAKAAVVGFISECRRNHIRKISIITGKGLHSDGGVPVVRNLVSSILAASEDVSESSKAPFNFGGSGAFWIILKK